MGEPDFLTGDRLVSRLDLELEPKTAAGRRVEVITGGGGCRRLSDDEKARAIEASLAPDAVVSEVARRERLAPAELHHFWGHDLRLRLAEHQWA
jgi:transposase